MFPLPPNILHHDLYKKRLSDIETQKKLEKKLDEHLYISPTKSDILHHFFQMLLKMPKLISQKNRNQE